MTEKQFKFDIPKEKRDKIDDLTNKPVEGTKYDTYRTDQPHLKDAYEGKINKETLEAKRLEYIDEAIQKVVSENKGIVDVRKEWLKEGKFDEETIKKDLWNSLGHDIAIELERIQGSDKLVSVHGRDKDVREHWHEFSANVVRERFFEWDFLNDDDIPKLKDTENAKKS